MVTWIDGGIYISSCHVCRYRFHSFPKTNGSCIPSRLHKYSSIITLMLASKPSTYLSVYLTILLLIYCHCRRKVLEHVLKQRQTFLVQRPRFNAWLIQRSYLPFHFANSNFSRPLWNDASKSLSFFFHLLDFKATFKVHRFDSRGCSAIRCVDPSL